MNKLKKSILKIVGLAVAGVAIAAAVLLILNSPTISKNDILKDPNKTVQKAFAKTVADIENSTFTPFEVAEKTLDKGSITITGDNGLNCLISHDLENKKYKTEYISQNSSWNWELCDYDMYITNNTHTYQLPLSNYKETIKASKIPEIREKFELSLATRINKFYPGFISAYKGEKSDSTGKARLLGENILKITNDAESIVEEEFLKINNRQVNVYSIEYMLDHETTILFLQSLTTWCDQYEQGYDDYVSNVIRAIISDVSNVQSTSQTYKEFFETALNCMKVVAFETTSPSVLKISIEPDSGYIVFFEWALTDMIYDAKTDSSLSVTFPLEYTGPNSYRICYEQKSTLDHLNCKMVFNLTQEETNESVNKSLSVDYQDNDTIWKEDESLYYNKTDNSFTIRTKADENDKTIYGNISLMGNETRLILEKIQIGGTEGVLNLSAVITDVPAAHILPANTIDVLNADIENTKSFYELTKKLPELVFGTYRFQVGNRIQ